MTEHKETSSEEIGNLFQERRNEMLAAGETIVRHLVMDHGLLSPEKYGSDLGLFIQESNDHMGAVMRGEIDLNDLSADEAK